MSPEPEVDAWEAKQRCTTDQLRGKLLYPRNTVIDDGKYRKGESGHVYMTKMLAQVLVQWSHVIAGRTRESLGCVWLHRP